MKFNAKSAIASLAMMLLCSGSVCAADWQKEIEELREDVLVLQRQMYRNTGNIASSGNTNTQKTAEDSAKGDVQVKISEYDEIIRKVNGRMDTLEYDLKKTNEKLDKINRDMEIRFKILEGRQVPANLSAPAKMPVGVTHDSPMADKPAREVAGDAIKGTDLEPLSGMAAIPEKDKDAPQPLVPMADINYQDKPENSAPLAKPASPEEMYQSGMQAYNAGLTDEAEIAFKEILQKFPKHNLAGNAQYWLGETYLKTGEYGKAKQAFKSGYEDYKNGNKAPDSLFKLGVTLTKLNDRKSSCIIYNSFESEFPKADAGLKSRVKTEAGKLDCK